MFRQAPFSESQKTHMRRFKDSEVYRTFSKLQDLVKTSQGAERQMSGDLRNSIRSIEPQKILARAVLLPRTTFLPFSCGCGALPYYSTLHFPDPLCVRSHPGAPRLRDISKLLTVLYAPARLPPAVLERTRTLTYKKRCVSFRAVSTEEERQELRAACHAATPIRLHFSDFRQLPHMSL